MSEVSVAGFAVAIGCVATVLDVVLTVILLDIAETKEFAEFAEIGKILYYNLYFGLLIL